MEVQRINEHELLSVHRELYSRGDCYLVQDRHMEVLAIGQRLPALVAWLNTQLHDEIDALSVASVYEASCKKLRLGYHKLRWKCDKVPVTEAAEAVQFARRLSYDNVVVVGNPNCYKISDRPGRKPAYDPPSLQA